MLKNGDRLEWFEQLESEGLAAPAALQSRPVLNPRLVPIWNAFQAVSSRRPIDGMGAVGRVPLVEVEAYFRLFDVDDPEDREDYLFFFDRLDGVYLDYVAEERKRKAAKAKKP